MSSVGSKIANNNLLDYSNSFLPSINSNSNIIVKLDIDGREFAIATAPYINEELAFMC